MSESRSKPERVFPEVRGNLMDVVPIDDLSELPDVAEVKKRMIFPSPDAKLDETAQQDGDTPSAEPDLDVPPRVDGFLPAAAPFLPEPPPPEKSAAVSLLTGILEDRYIKMEDKQLPEGEIDKAAFPALKNALNLAAPLPTTVFPSQEREKTPKLFDGLEPKRDGSYSTIAAAHTADGFSPNAEHMPELFAGIGKHYSDSDVKVTVDEHGHILPAPDADELFDMIEQYEENSQTAARAATEIKPAKAVVSDPYNTDFNFFGDDSELDNIPSLPTPPEIKLEPHKGD